MHALAIVAFVFSALPLLPGTAPSMALAAGLCVLFGLLLAGTGLAQEAYAFAALALTVRFLRLKVARRLW